MFGLLAVVLVCPTRVLFRGLFFDSSTSDVAGAWSSGGCWGVGGVWDCGNWAGGQGGDADVDEIASGAVESTTSWFLVINDLGNWHGYFAGVVSDVCPGSGAGSRWRGT